MDFDAVLKVEVLDYRVEDATLHLYLFDSIFTRTVRIDKLHNYVEEFCLLNNVCYGNGQKTLIQLSREHLERDWVLYSRTTTDKIELAG